MKNKTFLDSFYNAFQGFKNTLFYERNFKVHVICAVIAVILSIILRLDGLSFAVIILAVSIVITAELINTAVEAMVDLYCGEKLNPYAKIAKDAAAAAVLAASIFAVMIGMFIFGTRILELL